MAHDAVRSDRNAFAAISRSLRPLLLWSAAPFLCLLLLLSTGCAPSTERTPRPDKLRIGLVPEEREADIRKRYTPLTEHLSLRLGIPVEWVSATNFQEFLQLTREGKIDLGYYGGYTFVTAQRENGVIPLAMADIDLQFSSYFLVRKDNPARTIEEMKGTRIAFGSRLSTSGRLMPRHFLLKRGVEPETFFSEIHFTGAHDRTALWVQEGRADVGALSAPVAKRLFQAGRLDPDKVRILWETPHFADHVWALRPGFSLSFQTSVLLAFLELTLTDAGDRTILNSLGADGFLPAVQTDFDDLSRLVRILEKVP